MRPDPAVVTCPHCGGDLLPCAVQAAETSLVETADASAPELLRCSACAHLQLSDTSDSLTAAAAHIALARLQQAHAARARFLARNARLARDTAEAAQARKQTRGADASQSAVQAALARARMKPSQGDT